MYVGGDSSPLNARVLAVSECSDLAVIDIDGDGFTYVSWYHDEVKVGLDVFSAGFPLGTDEYTLTSGIVSKNDTSLESAWASVDHVVEHDARIKRCRRHPRRGLALDRRNNGRVLRRGPLTRGHRRHVHRGIAVRHK